MDDHRERRSGNDANRIEGVDSAGATIRRSWNMLAEGEDGPLIPSMAVAAIVRAELSGRRPPAGARASVDDVEVAYYEALFAAAPIRYGEVML